MMRHTGLRSVWVRALLPSLFLAAVVAESSCDIAAAATTPAQKTRALLSLQSDHACHRLSYLGRYADAAAACMTAAGEFERIAHRSSGDLRDEARFAEVLALMAA